MKYLFNIFKNGAACYLMLLIVLSQSMSLIALNTENSDFYPGCSYQNGEVPCISTGKRSTGFYVFAGGSACCGCNIHHSGILPTGFPELNVKSVTFYLTTSRNNSYYTTIENGPNDLKFILGDYESIATSVELSSKITDPVEHSWYLKFEFNPPVSVSENMEWELLDGDNNIYSAVWLHASDVDQEGLPGIYENMNCQYAETRDLWYSVKFETEGEIDDGDEEEPEESTEITSCIEITEPGYYLLKNDILDSNGFSYRKDLSVCILINSSDVVFDGNDHTIDGIDEMNSIGIQISGQSWQKNVTVKNIKIKDWKRGLSLGASESLVENSTFIDNDWGITLLSGINNNTIVNNIISNNDIGLYLLNNKNNLFKNDIINNNKVYGMIISNSNNNIFYNNLFNNYNNTYNDNSYNNWNTNNIKKENIVDGIYFGGNAWYHPSGYGFSQISPDSDNNDICDSEYEIDNDNIDKYPLASPRPDIIIKNIVIDNPSSWIGYPGFFRLYTFNENTAHISITIENTGEVDGKAVVRLEDFPDEIGKQIRMIDVSKDETVTTTITFNLSDYDELEGWTTHGFNTSGDYMFTVNVTDVTGNTSYDLKTDKITVKMGPRIKVHVDRDYDSDNDALIEMGEYFLLTFWVYNDGDEAVTWIELDSDNRFDGMQGRDVYNYKSDGLLVNDVWSFNQRNAYIYSEDMSSYTVSEVVDKFQWSATAVGVSRLNFDIQYKIGNSNYWSVGYNPAFFSVYDYTQKTLTEPKVTKGRDFQVTVTGISENSVKAKIENTGGVYYTYKINDVPTCPSRPCVDELLSFLPPGGMDYKTISTEGVITNYKFKIRYDYSSVLNTIDGLLNAVSPILPSPLDNVPLLLDIVIGLTKDNIDNKKLAETGISYLLDELTDPSSKYHQAIIDEVTEKYGSKIAGELATELAGGAIVQLPMALYKGFEWAWNNIKADASHTFTVTVVDPPLEYTVNSSNIPDSLFFGGLSNTISNEGTGSIQLSFDKNGKGNYSATYEIDTTDTSLSNMDFSKLSKLTVYESGKKVGDYLEGEVIIDIYFTENVSSDAYALLLADVGISESLIGSFFENLTNYQSSIVNEYIELKGEGILRVASFHDSINNLLVITKDKILGNYIASGAYANISDEDMLINLSFGPYLNVPLSNTKLTIDIPFSITSQSPQADSQDGLLQWNQAPQKIYIKAVKTTGTPGFEFLIILLSLLIISLLLWNRKK